MLQALSLALTLTFAGPAAAVPATSDGIVVAQQQPAPPAPARRDCEKNSEGIS